MTSCVPVTIDFPHGRHLKLFLPLLPSSLIPSDENTGAAQQPWVKCGLLEFSIPPSWSFDCLARPPLNDAALPQRRTDASFCPWDVDRGYSLIEVDIRGQQAQLIRDKELAQAITTSQEFVSSGFHLLLFQTIIVGSSENILRTLLFYSNAKLNIPLFLSEDAAERLRFHCNWLDDNPREKARLLSRGYAFRQDSSDPTYQRCTRLRRQQELRYSPMSKK